MTCNSELLHPANRCHDDHVRRSQDKSCVFLFEIRHMQESPQSLVMLLIGPLPTV